MAASTTDSEFVVSRLFFHFFLLNPLKSYHLPNEISIQLDEKNEIIYDKVTAKNIIHPELDLKDPTPDITKWAKRFNELFFDGNVVDADYEWSKKMTRCAGITYKNLESKKITIRLSVPELRIQPRKSTIESLLVSIEHTAHAFDSRPFNCLDSIFQTQHEMIHAFFFVLGEDCGHRKPFKNKAKEINEISGTNITTYHHFNMYDPVFYYRCIGPCRFRAPDYGWKEMNEELTPNSRSNGHAQHCDGVFLRVYNTHKEQLDRQMPDHMWRKEKSMLNESCNDVFEISSLIIKTDILMEKGGEFDEIDFIADFDDVIADNVFANYDETQRKLLSVKRLGIEDDEGVKPRNVCIICEKFVWDELVKQHLVECTGVSFEALKNRLPFYRLRWIHSSILVVEMRLNFVFVFLFSFLKL